MDLEERLCGFKTHLSKAGRRPAHKRAARATEGGKVQKVYKEVVEEKSWHARPPQVWKFEVLYRHAAAWRLFRLSIIQFELHLADDTWIRGVADSRND